MIPIEDENPTYNRAWVVYALIALNILVFWLEIITVLEGNFEAFIYSYATIPWEIANGQRLHTMFTSMFLHVGFLHIAGNMLFLYIFGNNIEDVLGKQKFILFYLFSGLTASFIQVAVDPGSKIPMLGASGAIAGVLGAYIYIYPRANVKSVLVIGFPLNIIYHLYAGFARIPAYLLISVWFLMQLFPGYMSLKHGFTGDIAYFAHIGGFIAGILLIRYISTDLDLAREKQRIYEGICARKSQRRRETLIREKESREKHLREEERRADIENIHRLLKLITETGGLNLKEAAIRLNISEDRIRTYLKCLREEDHLLTTDDPINPRLIPTKKSMQQYRSKKKQ